MCICMYVYYLEHLVPLLKLDINILSILHYLGSPLGFCTLIFDLMRNLYIYNVCLSYNAHYCLKGPHAMDLLPTLARLWITLLING